MRNRFADVFYEMAKENEDLCLVVADISPAGSMEQFRDKFPERFINTGVSEQSMIGIAAGLAQQGFRPFCYTIATFALYRPFEFIRNDLAYQNLPVTVVGIGGGLTYSTLGATHHAIEDVAVACAIPNMRVIAPCDLQETEEALRWCINESQGPVYLRLGKSGEPDLTSNAPEPWTNEVPRVVCAKEKDLKADIVILAYGPVPVRFAINIAKEMQLDGVSCSAFSFSTIKPLNEPALLSFMQGRMVVVIEEATGAPLASKLALLSQNNSATKIWSFCLLDGFCHTYGTQEELLNKSNLTYDKILNCIKAIKVVGDFISGRPL